MTANIWTQILDSLKADLDPEEFRRWFSDSSYASDSGDQITVWVMTAAQGRHISQNYLDRIRRELAAMGRGSTGVRFVASGYTGEEEDDEDDEE